ncbi:hypothetical protein LAZ67_16002137 [Cordylochernes scorpioides]|uniref:DUF5641 domain-containing protein n=1 Tax=Cordylochernes scorpioides TaxID=51811 RepID=A0ABY6LCP2_9ARAC|nr:hypothetical protein LAZ67_16002137 [Cordylochernes scorpioides]
MRDTCEPTPIKGYECVSRENNRPNSDTNAAGGVAIYRKLSSTFTAEVFQVAITDVTRVIKTKGDMCMTEVTCFAANTSFKFILGAVYIHPGASMQDIGMLLWQGLGPYIHNSHENPSSYFKNHYDSTHGIVCIAIASSADQTRLYGYVVEYKQDDPEDLTALTAGHFLIGMPLTTVPSLVRESGSSFKGRWQLVEQFKTDFWKRWSCEKFSRLQNRPKWLKPVDNIKIGTSVLLKEDNLPPLNWRMGRINQVGSTLLTDRDGATACYYRTELVSRISLVTKSKKSLARRLVSRKTRMLGRSYVESRTIRGLRDTQSLQSSRLGWSLRFARSPEYCVGGSRVQKKVSARWVPKKLTEEHKIKRVESATEFLCRYEEEGEEYLDSIVTGDETWAHHYTPETKNQSKQWRHPTSPKAEKGIDAAVE